MALKLIKPPKRPQRKEMSTMQSTMQDRTPADSEEAIESEDPRNVRKKTLYEVKYEKRAYAPPHKEKSTERVYRKREAVAERLTVSMKKSCVKVGAPEHENKCMYLPIKDLINLHLQFDAGLDYPRMVRRLCEAVKENTPIYGKYRQPDNPVIKAQFRNARYQINNRLKSLDAGKIPNAVGQKRSLDYLIKLLENNELYVGDENRTKTWISVLIDGSPEVFTSLFTKGLRSQTIPGNLTGLDGEGNPVFNETSRYTKINAPLFTQTRVNDDNIQVLALCNTYEMFFRLRNILSVSQTQLKARVTGRGRKSIPCRAFKELVDWYKSTGTAEPGHTFKKLEEKLGT